ncbi:hypothetical protein N665_0154s0008 [Sinapis alba]|nr:hypothetical protein N665_0154s0008 [Sinapis alba]
MESIVIPIFYGEDPELWIEWIDLFVSAHNFSDFETRQFAYGFIEGEALEWYCDEIARYVFDSWEDLKQRLFKRFCKSNEGAEKLSLHDRLKQLSRDMDRWDEDDAKNLHEEMLAAVDSEQGESSDGDLKIIDRNLGLTQPMEEQQEKYDLATFIAHETDEPLLWKSVATWSSEENEGSGNLQVGHYYERGKNLLDELFESGETNREEEYQQEEKKRSEIKKDKCAHHLLDKMTGREKMNAKKKKKKR